MNCSDLTEIQKYKQIFCCNSNENKILGINGINVTQRSQFQQVQQTPSAY